MADQKVFKKKLVFLKMNCSMQGVSFQYVLFGDRVVKDLWEGAGWERFTTRSWHPRGLFRTGFVPSCAGERSGGTWGPRALVWTPLCEKLKEFCVVSRVSSHTESRSTSAPSLVALTVSPSLSSPLLITASTCARRGCWKPLLGFECSSCVGSIVAVWETLCGEGEWLWTVM